jgi:uncharacterized membrane protein
MAIRNPVEWGADQFRSAGIAVNAANRGWRPAEDEATVSPPIVRHITVDDIRDALRSGLSDFGANRTDVIFLCIIYPLVGLVFARVASGGALLPELFPMASGFALLGPFFGLGLYEMSRRRELGVGRGWSDAFRVLGSPSLGAIALLGLVLGVIFVMWLVVAYVIYLVTLGPLPLVSIGSFIRDVFTTTGGWAMIAVGIGVGFLFAALVLAISVVAFPLLLDRQAGIETAVATSIRTMMVNPGPIALWGLIVAGGLVLGSIPLFVGLALVLPVLGHATWHLYRKAVVWPRPLAGESGPGSNGAADATMPRDWDE